MKNNFSRFYNSFIFAGAVLVLIFASCDSPTGGGGARTYTVSGTVKTGEGESGAGAAIEIWADDGSEDALYSATADQDGVYTVKDVAAGTYTIKASIEDQEAADTITVPDEVEKELTLQKAVGGTGDSGGDSGVDAVSGASVSTGSGGSANIDHIDPIVVPATRKTFTGSFTAALNEVKDYPPGAYLVKPSYGGPQRPYDMTGFNTPVTIVIENAYVSLEGGYDGKGSLLTIRNGVTVILKDTGFTGCDSNTRAIITVEAGGKLVMKDGSVISGAERSPVDGGAVRVNAGGVFQMDGGAISNNTGISNGGAVFISGGKFLMTGGEISGNQASNVGGVFMYNGGSFIMTGGEISGNTSKNYAGGVLVNGGQFELRGGLIKDNVCHLYGGGVFVGYYSHLSGSGTGVFKQTGGVISGNRSAGGGGGVSVRGSSAVFVLSGGEISGNKAVPDDTIDPYGGGGVFVQDGLFIFEGGKVVNNETAYELWGGGGILVHPVSISDGAGNGVDAVSGASSGGGGASGVSGREYQPGLTMNGGVISGNTAGNGMGAAIYAGGGEFAVSASPSVSGSVLIEYQPDAAQHILIDGGYTGSTLALDLRGDENGISFIGNWIKPLLRMASGGSIPSDVRGRFALHTFRTYNGSPMSITSYTIGSNGKIKSP